MKKVKINTLKYFLYTELSLSIKEDIEVERDMFNGETFSLNTNFSREKLKFLLKKYFLASRGVLKIIKKTDELSLNFLYKIQEESGAGTIYYFLKNNKLWVNTYIS